MKFCSKCGAQVNDEAVICVSCGCAIEGANRPVRQLKTTRGLLKYIIFSLITFGIYPLVMMTLVGEEMNLVASKYDGKKTMNFCLVAFIFSWLTFGIVPLVWYHNISKRMGNELARRGIAYSFGAGSFWGWNILGAFIVIGPLVYTHKFCKAINLINENYNING